MHVRKVRLCSFLLLLLVSSGALQAMPERQSPQSAVQINQDVERIFQRAVSHYKSGQYDVVEYELQGLLNIYPLNHRTTAIYYLIGRAQYKQKKFGQARETLERLIKNFPTSAYVDDALYLLAAIDFEQQMYEDCAKKLLTVLNKTDDLRLRDRVRNLLFPLLTDYIPLEKLRALRQEFRTGPAAADLDLALAVQEFRAGKRDAAKNLLKAWLSSNPAHPLKDVAENFLARASQVRPKKIRVGVVLPLTGYFKQEAQSLLDGIRYALLEDPSARQLGLELLVRDSQGDMLQTIRTA
ncbi:MAG TPA: outer membrane protein assembly factor BamD, partial [Bacteroidetes bacterium]|nr:outer membrane protein assembly factor BamD [Bacteroidota bacterium]